WTAEHTTEVIHPLGWFGQTVEVHKPIPGVEDVVPEVFEHGAMKGVASGASHDCDLRAGSAPELRRKRRGLDAELLQGVDRDQAIGATSGAERGQSSARRLHHGEKAGDAKVGADSIHGEVVGVGSLSVDAELSLVVKASGGYDCARRKRDQRLETPAVE